jgi:hypothetical protein
MFPSASMAPPKSRPQRTTSMERFDTLTPPAGCRLAYTRKASSIGLHRRMGVSYALRAALRAMKCNTHAALDPALCEISEIVQQQRCMPDRIGFHITQALLSSFPLTANTPFSDALHTAKNKKLVFMHLITVSATSKQDTSWHRY